VIEIWIDFLDGKLGVDGSIGEDQIALDSLSWRPSMSSKQTRRSISVRGTTYDSLRRYSAAQSRAMSDIVEELLAGLLAKQSALPKAQSRVSAPSKRTVAARVVRAPAPPVAAPRSGAPGRPAPTPAAKVTGTRRVEAPRGDYRTISF
jgi:hypothetical protein